MNKIEPEANHLFNQNQHQDSQTNSNHQNPINKFTSKRFLRSKTCEEIYKEFSAKKERQRNNKSLSRAKKKLDTTNRKNKQRDTSHLTKQNYSNTPKRQGQSQYTQKQHQKESNKHFDQNQTISKLQTQNECRIRYSDKKYQNSSNHKTRMNNLKKSNRTNKEIFQISKENEEQQKYSIFDLNVSQMNSQIMTDLKMTTIILQQKLNLKDEEMHLLSENYQKLREEYQKLLKITEQQKNKNNFQNGQTSPRFKEFKKQNSYLRQNEEALKQLMITKKRGDIQKKFQQLQQRISEQFQSEELKNSNLINKEKQRQKQMFQNSELNLYPLTVSEIVQKNLNSLNQRQNAKNTSLPNKISRFRPTEIQQQGQNNRHFSSSQVIQSNHSSSYAKGYNKNRNYQNRQQASLISNFKPFSPIDIFQVSSIPIQNRTAQQPHSNFNLYRQTNFNNHHNSSQINSIKMVKPSRDTTQPYRQSQISTDNDRFNKKFYQQSPNNMKLKKQQKDNFQIPYSYSLNKNYANVPKKSRPPLPKSSQKIQSNQLISNSQLDENQISSTNLFQKALNKTNNYSRSSKKSYNSNLKSSNKNKMNYINKFIEQNMNQNNQAQDVFNRQKSQKMISDFILQSQNQQVRSDIKQIK